MPSSPRRLPPLNSMRAFEAAGRRLSFKHAADELSVTQGAVSQQIRILEGSLGFKVFERYPRHIELTEAGRSYLADVRRAFELLSDATRAARQEKGHVTISVPPSFAVMWLLPRLPAFRETFPEIELRVLATEKLSDMHSESVDIVVRQGRPRYEAGILTTVLFEQTVLAVCSPRLVEIHGPPASIKDMEHFVLLHDTDNHWPLYLRHLFGSDQCTPIMSFTFSLTMLAIIAAGLGQGVALATEAFVEGELRAGSLVKLFESPLFVDQSFNLMTRETALRNHAVRAVCDWLQLQGEPYRAPTPVADV